MEAKQFETLCKIIILCAKAIVSANAHPNSDFGMTALEHIEEAEAEL